MLAERERRLRCVDMSFDKRVSLELKGTIISVVPGVSRAGVVRVGNVSRVHPSECSSKPNSQVAVCIAGLGVP